MWFGTSGRARYFVLRQIRPSRGGYPAVSCVETRIVLANSSAMSSWWPSWLWWATSKRGPMKPTDALHHPTLRARFRTFLDMTEPPATFKAAEVAQDLRVSHFGSQDLRLLKICVLTSEGRLGMEVTGWPARSIPGLSHLLTFRPVNTGQRISESRLRAVG